MVKKRNKQTAKINPQAWTKADWFYGIVFALLVLSAYFEIKYAEYVEMPGRISKLESYLSWVSILSIAVLPCYAAFKIIKKKGKWAHLALLATGVLINFAAYSLYTGVKQDELKAETTKRIELLVASLSDFHKKNKGYPATLSELGRQGYEVPMSAFKQTTGEPAGFGYTRSKNGKNYTVTYRLIYQSCTVTEASPPDCY